MRSASATRRTPGFHAQELHIEAVQRPRRLSIRYTVDRGDVETLEVELPHASSPALKLVIAAAAVYLGSLCLARTVTIAGPLPGGLLDDLLQVAEMIYDIRRWRERLPLSGPPALIAGRGAAQCGAADRELVQDSAVALWSGGKDSTLAILTLKANGYEVHPLFLPANFGVEARERRAIAELLPLLDLPSCREFVYEHPDFIELTNSYATAWDRFPLSNRVPFGRDLLLAAIAVPLALELGAACISMGHDHECRNAEVAYLGRRIPRNDLESARAASALEAIIQRHVHPYLRLLPPVANLPELRILRDMFLDHPELMRRTSFCFWGSNCGRCGKCLRYFLADRVYSPGLLHFKANPLAAGACPELGELLDGPEELFEKEVLVLLGRLAERGDIREGEEELERFAASRLDEVRPNLDAWEAELLAEYEDPQIPAALRPVSFLRTHVASA